MDDNLAGLRPSCLAHVAAQVAHADYLVWRWIDAAQLVLWMIPAYSTLRRELRVSQDMLADHEAVRATGDEIEGLDIVANYVKPRPQQYISFVNGSDIIFGRQARGLYRSSQMLPDEEVKLTVSAKGFAPITERVSLKEGATRQLKVTLAKTPANER